MKAYKTWCLGLAVAFGSTSAVAYAAGPVPTASEPRLAQRAMGAKALERPSPTKAPRNVPVRRVSNVRPLDLRSLLDPKFALEIEGTLHGLGDGSVILAVPSKAERRAKPIQNRGQPSIPRNMSAPKGTVLRAFLVSPLDGPTQPMLERRLGQKVRVDLVRDQGGTVYVQRIQDVR